MSRRRLWIAIPIVVLVLGGLAYLGVGYAIYNQLSSVKHGGGVNAQNVPSHFVTESGTPDLTADWMPAYEAITITSRQPGVNLATWYIPAQEANAPVVIMVHGLNGCKCNPSVLLAASMLHRHGFNVIALDLRNMGMSDITNGRYAAGTNEYRDALGVFDWLVTVKGVPPEKIGIWGGSLGAATALDAFAAEPKLAAVFADSPFSDMPTTLNEELERNHLPTWLAQTGLFMAKVVSGDDLLSIAPTDAMRQNGGRPIFLTHGELDTRLKVHHSRDLLALAQQNNANIETWFVPDTEHTQAIWVHTAEYETKLTDFFTKALKR